MIDHHPSFSHPYHRPINLPLDIEFIRFNCLLIPVTVLPSRSNQLSLHFKFRFMHLTFPSHYLRSHPDSLTLYLIIFCLYQICWMAILAQFQLYEIRQFCFRSLRLWAKVFSRLHVSGWILECLHKQRPHIESGWQFPL